MVTVSVIKADIGGMVGHSSSHPDILALGQRELDAAKQSGLLIDGHGSALRRRHVPDHDARPGRG